MAAAPIDSASGTIGLKRSLRFWDLVLYGIILIQPTAPMPVFGVLYDVSRGHVVTVILLAMVAMMFTSISYGRMARVYPHGGSAFLYVGREIHPTLGYITGVDLHHLVQPLCHDLFARHSLLGIGHLLRTALHGSQLQRR